MLTDWMLTQPPLALELARRNKLEHLLPFDTVEGAAKAYSHYDNLQQFLDLRDATLSVNLFACKCSATPDFCASPSRGSLACACCGLAEIRHCRCWSPLNFAVLCLASSWLLGFDSTFRICR